MMEELKQFLKDAGYEGEMSVSAIEAFLAQNPGVTISGDWRSAFDAPKSDAPAPKSFDANALIVKDQAARIKVMETETARLKAVRETAVRVNDDGHNPDDPNLAALRAYDARVKGGKTRFKSAARAEAVGASIRYACYGGREYARRDEDMEILKRNKALNTINGSSGGYLIAPEFAADILYSTETVGVARKIFNVQTMGTGQKLFRRKTSNVTMAPVIEGVAYGTVQPGYDLVTLTARDAAATIQYTRQLWNDSAVNIADEIARAFQEAADDRIDRDAFIGDGTATSNNIQGLQTAGTGLVSNVNASGATWASITTTDLYNLLAAPQFGNPGDRVFLGSTQAFIQIALRIAGVQAKGSIDKAIAAFEPFGGGDAMLMGRPFYFEDRYLPSASASATRSLYYGDFKALGMVGIREELETAVDEYTGQNRGLVNVNGFMRYDVLLHGHGRRNETTGAPITTGAVAALITT